MAIDKNLYEKNQAAKLANDYSFFPATRMRFEQQDPRTFVSWGFYANRSNRINVHIKYNPIELNAE